MDNCLFCKIVNGEIPANKIYKDADLFVFNDINPAAPVHFMIIPKLHIASLSETMPTHQRLLGDMSHNWQKNKVVTTVFVPLSTPATPVDKKFFICIFILLVEKSACPG